MHISIKLTDRDLLNIDNAAVNELICALKTISTRTAQGTEELVASETTLSPQVAQIPTPAPAAPAPLVVPAAAPHQVTPPQMTQPKVLSPVATVPVAEAKQYTLPELQRACAPLLDTGKSAELVALLAKYNVPDLTKVPPEMYGALAADLRALGARL